MKNYLLFIFSLFLSSLAFAQGSETFENASLPGSYSDGSFTGDNSVTWSYVESRNDDGYEITNEGILLRRTASSSALSATVPGGIGDFTCNLKKAYTGSGNRQVELFINGVSQGTSIAFDNTTVQTFNVTGINISGNVLIEIKNITSKQVVVDNIVWTGYDPSTPGIALTAISGNTNESGTQATFDVSLIAPPVSDVVIDVTSANIAENTVSPTTLTFNSGNYNVAQTVTVTGVDDATVDGDQTTTITIAVDDALSDNDYDGLSETIDVTNEDDECGITNVNVVYSGCDGDDANIELTWTETNTSGAIEVDIDGNGYQSMNSGDTYTITGPTTAATNLTVTVRDANETTCFGTTTVDILDCPQPTPEIYISEVSDASTYTNEFLELYNNSSFDVNLTGYKLIMVTASSNNSSFVYDFGTDGSGEVIIPANGFLVVARGASSETNFKSSFPAFPAAAAFNTGSTSLYFGTGTAARWRLRGDDGSANSDDGTLIDDTNGAVGGSNDRDYQNTPGSFTSTSRGSATPGEFDATQVLPVELLSFNATRNNQTTILTWETASEENNAYFNIQHSTDGTNFETIGQVEGSGTSYTAQTYNFVDENPSNGLNYYRLQQMDFDGKFEYHRVLSVLITNKQNDVAIVPTLVNNQFEIVLSETVNVTTEIEIYNINGQVIKSESINIDGNRKMIDVSSFNAGSYFIRLNINNSIVTKRFIKL